MLLVEWQEEQLARINLLHHLQMFSPSFLWSSVWPCSLTGWPQSRRKKFPEFSRLFQSHKLTFPLVTAAIKCNNDLHQGSLDINSSNITGHHRTLTSSLFLMILFTQSTAVLHKYLNNELKILCLLQFFPEVAQNSLRIPWVFHVQRNLWVLGFPGLWPPWLSPMAAGWFHINCKTFCRPSVFFGFGWNVL